MKLNIAATLLCATLLLNSATAQQNGNGVLCQGSKLDEFTSTIDACDNLAELDFFSNLFSSDASQSVNEGLCKRFEEKINCWYKANSNLNCLTEEKLEQVTDNLKYDELKRAFNNSDSLGTDYVGECRMLSLYERKVLREVYGSAKCTMFEIFQIIADRKACDVAVNKRKDLLADLATTGDALKRVVCLGYQGHERCQEPIYRCMSNAIENETRQERAQNWVEDQKELQEIPIFSDFSYSSCSSISSRQKRFAMAEAKVQLNDYEMAIFKKVLADDGASK